MKIAFVGHSREKLGVEYLSAVLKAHGHRVEFFIDDQLFNDEHISCRYLSRVFDSKEKIVSGLKTYKPDLIGMSVITMFYEWAGVMAASIKRKMDVPIIFGGIHPTMVPERVIANDNVDIVCVGEGEYPLLELVQSMERGAIDYGIKNLWFKNGGRIIANDIRPLLGDLNELPFADKEIFYSARPHYAQTYYIVTGRGCAHACSYCGHSYLKELYRGKGPYVRRRTVDNVIAELKLAKERYRARYVRFYDDNFTENKEWLREFSDRYRKHIGLPFVCNVHPNHIDEQTVSGLRAAAYCEVNMGVQSLNPSIREQIMLRHHSNARVAKAITLLMDNNIRCEVENILACPTETEDDWMKMMEFYNRHRPYRVTLYLLKFFPKTSITEWARKQGIVDAAEYERIMNGEGLQSLYHGSKSQENHLFGVNVLLALMPILPRRLVDYLLRKRWYRFLSCLSLARVLDTINELGRYCARSNYETFPLSFRIRAAWDALFRRIDNGDRKKTAAVSGAD